MLADSGWAKAPMELGASSGRVNGRDKLRGMPVSAAESGAAPSYRYSGDTNFCRVGPVHLEPIQTLSDRYAEARKMRAFLLAAKLSCRLTQKEKNIDLPVVIAFTCVRKIQVILHTYIYVFSFIKKEVWNKMIVTSWDKITLV